MSIGVLFTVFLHFFQGDSASPWPFQHVDKSANLSNSAITSVYMDRFDHVWLGTWDGLDRYDGSSIRVYKPDPFLKGTISNNVIRNFLEDGHGNLWIVTHQGINKYDRTTDSFHSYLDSLNDIPFLEYNIRACVGSDSAIWTSLIGKGISRYSMTQDAFLPVTFEGIDAEWLKTVVDLFQHEGLLYLLGSDGKLICTLNNRLVYSKQLVTLNQLAFHKFLRISHTPYVAIANGAGQLLMVNLANMAKEHPARPALLRQWAHVNITGAPFRHAVCAVGVEQGGALVPSATNSGLGAAEQRSLENVLMELRMTETDEKSGAWLFARITSDGRSAEVERAYDTWPAWYVAPAAGPTMSALHAEMDQRAPSWRPAWAGLLPSERF